jgi:hypothetical protein
MHTRSTPAFRKPIARTPPTAPGPRIATVT